YGGGMCGASCGDELCVLETEALERGACGGVREVGRVRRLRLGRSMDDVDPAERLPAVLRHDLGTEHVRDLGWQAGGRLRPASVARELQWAGAKDVLDRDLAKRDARPAVELDLAREERGERI